MYVTPFVSQMLNDAFFKGCVNYIISVENFVLCIGIKPAQINNSFQRSCKVSLQKVSHRGIFVTLTEKCMMEFYCENG